MQFESFTEFLHMGGYAVWVWWSFVGTLACFALLAFEAVMRRKTLVNEARKHAARAERILQARQARKQQKAAH